MEDPEKVCERVRYAMTLVGDYARQASNDAYPENMSQDKIMTLAAICRAAGTLAISTAKWIEENQGN
jgi:hypothetical protein